VIFFLPAIGYITMSELVAVTGDWRKLYREEIQNMYFSPSVVRTSGDGWGM
jgi:hypothetical protein